MANADDKFFEELVRPGSGAASSGQAKTPAPKGKAADEAEGQLTIDVYQTPEDIVIESAIAAVRPEDIDIEVSSDAVTIRGARERETTVSDEDYFYRECYWGRFSRSVILPQEVDPDHASVTFKNGVLSVRLPKLDRKKTKKLKVNA